MFFGEEPLRRHVDEFRISDMSDPISESHAKGLAYDVNIVSRVVSDASKIVPFEDIEYLEYGDPSSRRSSTLDPIASIRRRDRVAGAQLVVSEILLANETVVLGEVSGDLRSDLSLIEVHPLRRMPAVAWYSPRPC